MYFYEKYLSINLKNYENIGIDLEISKVLLGLLVGIIIATLLVSWQRNSMINLMKRMSRLGCTDEGTAKTLSELSCNNLGTRAVIRTSSRLRRLIGCLGADIVTGDNITYEEYKEATRRKKRKAPEGEAVEERRQLNEKIDFKSAAFYIKSSDSKEVKNILDMRKASLLNTVLMCVLLISVYTILLFLMPDILNFINGILG